MSKSFQGRYQVQDGYAGGARPRFVRIDARDLEEDMTDDEILDFYEIAIEDHFRETVSPGSELRDEFLVWAKEQITKRGANHE